MTDFSSGSGAHGSLPPLLADAGRLGRAIEAGAVALWEWHIAEDMMRISPRLAELLGLAPPFSPFRRAVSSPWSCQTTSRC